MVSPLDASKRLVDSGIQIARGLFSSKERQERRAPPTPDTYLQSIWSGLIQEYFPDREELLHYSVSWSPRRQKRVLASVAIERKIVRVAQELQHQDYQHFLAPLLYHELCHAVIGNKVDVRKRKRLWHGPSFKLLEAQHPEVASLHLWIKQGGWAQAVRRHRARQRFQR